MVVYLPRRLMRELEEIAAGESNGVGAVIRRLLSAALERARAA